MARHFTEDGTVYFLGMELWDDHDIGCDSLPYYKLGFTGVNVDDVKNRIAQHQTGNPFRIKCHFTIKSNFAGGLETWVQKRYDKYAVGQNDPNWHREWFRFQSFDMLEDAYKATEKQNELFAGVAKELKSFEKEQSDGDYIEPTAKVKNLMSKWSGYHSDRNYAQREILEATKDIEISRNIKKRLATLGEEPAPEDDKPPTEPIIPPFKPKPDWDAIMKQWPDEYARCHVEFVCETKKVLGDYQIGVGDEVPLTPEQRATGLIRGKIFNPDFPVEDHKHRVLPDSKIEELEERIQIKTRHQTHIDIDKEYIEIELRVACGMHEGIRDTYMWKREYQIHPERTRNKFIKSFAEKIILEKEPTPVTADTP